MLHPHKTNLRRLPRTGARRSELQHRRAAHWILPPSDGSFAEWQSWGSESHVCLHCRRTSVVRVHLAVHTADGGAYTILRQCGHCGDIRDEPALSRLEVIDKGRTLRGWLPIPEWRSLQYELDTQRWRQRASVRAASRATSGGTPGGKGA